MKKLFVAVLALAALAACNKDSEMQFIETNKKAVDFSIANYLEETRVIDAPADSEVKGNGQVGTIEAQVADDALAAAKADELVLLFANNANVVEQAYDVKSLTLTDGVCRIHDINESVTQVAVVRKVDTATKGTDGVWTYTYDIAPANYIGDNLSVYRAAALVEYDDNRGLAGMDLFAVKGLGTPQGTCTVEDPTDHKTTFTYTLFKATVEVKPMLARVEVTRISCTDLGETTYKAANGTIEDGKVVTGGFDELVLGTIKFGANANYTYDLNDFVLKGVYEKGNKTTKRDLTYFEAGDDDTKYAVAWNIATETAYPLVASNAMTLDMVASAYDYTVVNTAQNLTIGFDKAGTKFEPGKIYRIAIDFKESNLDKSNEAICVEVTVKIADWVIVPVEPTFKN